MFSSRCATEPVPGMGSIAGERASSHAIATWCGVASCAAATRLELALVADAAALERRPRQEPDRRGLAAGEHVVGAPVDGAVAVLHRHDRREGERAVELGDRHVREPDVADLALAPELDERADGVLERHPRVRPVELVERDLFESQPLQALVAHGAQVLRSTVRSPPVRAVAQEPALGRDHDVVGVGVQRLGDELLAHRGTVRVGGVDEVHAELDRAPQDRDRLVVVGGVAPDAGAGDAHRAEAEAAHGEIAEGERRGVRVGHAADATASEVFPLTGSGKPDGDHR